jgi:hypothetical protein
MEINKDTENPDKVLETHLNKATFKQFNTAETMDIELLISKIEFTDFLKAIQREATLRHILTEHQMYFHSFKRIY